MEEVKRIKLTHTSKLEAVPELIQHIQSLLPVKEAARTCVLSKSWLHALSTNPVLRFGQSLNLHNIQGRLLYINLIDRTILRYFRENIPITSFRLKMVIDDRQSYSFVNKWMRQMASKSSITEIYLKLYIYTCEFKLSDEIFTSENLKKVSLCMYAFLCSNWKNPISSITGPMSSVRELNLNLKVIDKTFPWLLESRFPFLESLNFKFRSSSMDNLDIKCVSLKRLAIKVQQRHPIRVQVFAPELITFHYTGGVTMPSFLFSAIPPKQFELNLKLKMPIDMSFFLNLRETLNLSTKFNVKISTSCELIKQFDVDIDDLRIQVPCPALNVQQLSFGACPGEDLWGQSEFFDSFFSICSPGYITAIKSLSPTWKTLK